MEKVGTNEKTIQDFELLVEELMKNDPDEAQVKQLMQKLDLTYDSDPVDRIALVLERMNQLVFDRKTKKDDYDFR